MTLLLVGGLMLLHAGSIWVHERAVHGLERGAWVERLADRLVAAGEAVKDLPDEARDAAAHAQSRPGLDLHWDRSPPIGAGMPVPEALAEVASRMGPTARLGWDQRAEPGHRFIGAVPIEEGGWIIASATWLNASETQGGSAILSMAAMAVGIGLASMLIIRWITGPLRRLALAADEIGRDLRTRPLPTEGPNEVRQAAIAFNAMQSRIARLVEDRTEALAAMSHDLRTPLSRLRLRIGFMEEGEERVRLDADIAEMETMIARTLDYLREGRDREPVRPTDLATILQTLATDATDQGHDVAYSGPPRVVLPVRPLATKRAISNLVENALRHGKAPVRLRIEDEPAQVVVSVVDAGPGIAAADRARALEPFGQLDAARGKGGSGLGLAIVSRFVEASGGSLELVNPADGQGLVVRVSLPRTPS